VIESAAAKRSLSISQWRLAVVVAGYLLGLALMANLAFGTSTFFGKQGTGPARTGAYDTRLPVVGIVDPMTIGKAITEAAGGPPTIGMPLPAPQPQPVAAKPAQPVAVARITAKTTPTYTATKAVATNPYASLLALIPTNLTFPGRARPHRH
jgi:hypothetical protein